MAIPARRPLNGPVGRTGNGRPTQDLTAVIANSVSVAATSDASVASSALVAITGGDPTTIRDLNDRVTALEHEATP